MVTKKKEVKEDVVEIISRKELEKCTKAVRAKFPKNYRIEGIYKMGNIRIDDEKGDWLCEMDCSNEAIRKAFCQ